MQSRDLSRGASLGLRARPIQNDVSFSRPTCSFSVPRRSIYRCRSISALCSCAPGACWLLCRAVLATAVALGLLTLPCTPLLRTHRQIASGFYRRIDWRIQTAKTTLSYSSGQSVTPNFATGGTLVALHLSCGATATASQLPPAQEKF